MIDLAKLVDDTSLAELPEVAAALELARFKLALRLAALAPAQQPPSVGKWLTPDEAATIARASKRQVQR